MNGEFGIPDPKLSKEIQTAASEVTEGRLTLHFPLVVFQTGSGTQSNLYDNEVILIRAIELLGGLMGSRKT